MITAYLMAIPGYGENEDIEVRYRIYKGEDLLCKENVYTNYEKPLFVGLVSLKVIIKKLKEYEDEKITIIINDPALNELIKETSTTENRGLLRMAGLTKDKLEAFTYPIIVKDISDNKLETAKWIEITKP